MSKFELKKKFILKKQFIYLLNLFNCLLIMNVNLKVIKNGKENIRTFEFVSKYF